MLLVGIAAHAQDKNAGIGIILGEPTGFSYKQWTSETTAIDAAIAWSFVDEQSLHLHSDFLMHHFDIFPVTVGKLPLYYGIGGRIAFRSDVEIGVRIPVGANYLFDDVPIGAFLEIVPGINVIPSTDFYLNAAIGARYYIK